jgi:hypothetical protein
VACKRKLEKQSPVAAFRLPTTSCSSTAGFPTLALRVTPFDADELDATGESFGVSTAGSDLPRIPEHLYLPKSVHAGIAEGPGLCSELRLPWKLGARDVVHNAFPLRSSAALRAQHMNTFQNAGLHVSRTAACVYTAAE